MYMPNARILRLEPKATYIPLTRVGVLYWVKRKFASPNVNDTNMLVSFALGDAKVPNTNDFASQWNIGFREIDCTVNRLSHSFRKENTRQQRLIFDHLIYKE